jgi:hypothetical protein
MDQTLHRVYYSRSQNLPTSSTFPGFPTSVSIRPTPLVVLHLNIDICGSLVDYFASGKLAQCHRDGLELLRPFIAARRDEKMEEKSETFVRRILSVLHENYPSSAQNDYLSWLIDEAKGKDREDSSIAARMFGLSFVGIQTSSMVSLPSHHVNMDSSVVQAVTHALLDLVSNPEYMRPLREEVEEVTNREGWTKAALDQMHKVDSFLKESQRVNPVGVCEWV